MMQRIEIVALAVVLVLCSYATSLSTEGDASMLVRKSNSATGFKSRRLQDTLNITECKTNATSYKKLYLAQFADYIMKTATLHIINDKANGTLDTSGLEDLMLDSNGDFKSNDDDDFNENFPIWKTTIPDNITRTFARYSCKYYDSSQDGYMDKFCNNELTSPPSSFPRQGYIYMRSDEVSKSRRREIAAILCDSVSSEWDALLTSMTNAYLDEGLLEKIKGRTSSTVMTNSKATKKPTRSPTPGPTASKSATTVISDAFKIPIQFYVRTPKEYPEDYTSAKVQSIVANSLNSTFALLYSRRLRRWLQDTVDRPIVTSVELKSIQPIACPEPYACYNFTTNAIVDLNNYSSKQLKKKLNQNPLLLNTTDGISFFTDVNSLQKSSQVSKSTSSKSNSLIWGIVLSVVGVILLLAIVYMSCRLKKRNADKNKSKWNFKWFKRLPNENPTPPVSPEKEEKADAFNIDDLSVEFKPQHSPMREYCVDIRSLQRAANEENRTPNFTESCGSSSVASPSLFDSTKSVAKSVYSAIEMVLTKEPADQETQSFTEGMAKTSPAVCDDDELKIVEDEEPPIIVSSSAAPAIVKNRGRKSKWAVALDQSSGDKYYYNRITKETTWDKPASFDGDEEVDSIPVFPSKTKEPEAATVVLEGNKEDSVIRKKREEIEAMLNKISPFEKEQNEVLLKTFSGKEDLLLLQLKESAAHISNESEKSSAKQVTEADGDDALPLNKTASTATNFSMGTQRMSNTSGKNVFRMAGNALPKKQTKQDARKMMHVRSLSNLDESVLSDDSDPLPDGRKGSNSFYDDSSVSELSGFTDKSSDDSDAVSISSANFKRREQNPRVKNVSQMHKKKAQLKNAVHKKDWVTASTVAVWLQGLNNRGRSVDKSRSRIKHVYSFRSHAELEEEFDQLLKGNNMDAIVALIDSMLHTDVEESSPDRSGIPKKTLGARSNLQQIPETSRKLLV